MRVTGRRTRSLNVNSPGEIDEAGIRYVDCELDVSRKLPGPAVIVDEDEFREAAEMFGYSAEFREACYEGTREASGRSWAPAARAVYHP